MLLALQENSDQIVIVIPSLIDFFVVLIILFGIFRGYTQGFIVQTISLFTLLAGIYVSVHLSMAFYNALVDKSNVPLRNLPVIAFALLFAFVVFGSNWVGVYVKKMVSPVKVNLYARFIGGFFGALKYLFIASVLLLFIDRLNDSFNIYDSEKSKLFGPVSKFAPTVIPKLNFEIKQPDPLDLKDIQYEQIPADDVEEI